LCPVLALLKNLASVPQNIVDYGIFGLGHIHFTF
jgi:hypothetical protein